MHAAGYQKSCGTIWSFDRTAPAVLPQQLFRFYRSALRIMACMDARILRDRSAAGCGNFFHRAPQAGAGFTPGSVLRPRYVLFAILSRDLVTDLPGADASLPGY